jgi:RNA-binding protein YhbY
MDAQIKEAKKQLNGIKSEFHLGKQGITPSFIESIKKYLIAHSIVKIKVLIAAKHSEVKTFAQEVAKETGSEVIEIKGFTFSLYLKQE